MSGLEASPFDRHYGLEVDEAGEELVRAHVPVVKHVTQPLPPRAGGVGPPTAAAPPPPPSRSPRWERPSAWCPAAASGSGSPTTPPSSARSDGGRSTRLRAVGTAGEPPGSGTLS